MGLNLLVVDKDEQDHPDWDWGRFAGDREIPDILQECHHHHIMFGHPPDEERGVRPEDVEGFRKALLSHFDYNVDRWQQLCDILKDERWWIRFSV